MALAGVLSALRELILDAPPLPGSAAERLAFYSERFPALSEAEREDLAQIDPQRLKIYTGTIFAGERSVLGNHFPLTFALLAQPLENVTSGPATLWEAHFGEPLNRVGLVKDLHRRRPWNGATTKRLARNFVEYLTVDRPELSSLFPSLHDVATLELCTLESARAKEDHLPGSFDIVRLESLTVGELLACRVYVPSPTRLVAFEHDVIAAREEFYRQGRMLSKPPVAGATYGASGRNRYGTVRWTALSEPVFELLSESPVDEPFAIELLAEAAASAFDEGADEAELFQHFAALLKRLLEQGVIRLAPDPSA